MGKSCATTLSDGSHLGFKLSMGKSCATTLSDGSHLGFKLPSCATTLDGSHLGFKLSIGAHGSRMDLHPQLDVSIIFLPTRSSSKRNS